MPGKASELDQKDGVFPLDFRKEVRVYSDGSTCRKGSSWGWIVSTDTFSVFGSGIVARQGSKTPDSFYGEMLGAYTAIQYLNQRLDNRPEEKVYDQVKIYIDHDMARQWMCFAKNGGSDTGKKRDKRKKFWDKVMPELKRCFKRIKDLKIVFLGGVPGSKRPDEYHRCHWLAYLEFPGRTMRANHGKRKIYGQEKLTREESVQLVAYFRYLYRITNGIHGSAHEDYCHAAAEYDARHK